MNYLKHAQQCFLSNVPVTVAVPGCAGLGSRVLGSRAIGWQWARPPGKRRQAAPAPMPSDASTAQGISAVLRIFSTQSFCASGSSSGPRRLLGHGWVNPMSGAAELRSFILRQEVLHLYRQLLRVAKGAQDPASRGAMGARLFRQLACLPAHPAPLLPKYDRSR